MTPRRRGHLVASGLAVLALTLTGCGAAGDTGLTGASDPSGTQSSGPAESPTATPTPTPAPSSKAPSTPASSPAEQESTAMPVARGLRGELLPAEEVPGFNDEFAWRERSTRKREGRSPFGTCHKFAMTSIGATRVAVRSYAPVVDGSDSTASHLVARFADEMTAKRAYEVIRSWREQCADALRDYENTDIGKLQPVALDDQDAVGGWYLLVYGPAGDPDSAYFDAQGMARVGRTISLIQMRLVGQDYNYRQGEEPMVGAVRNAVGRIG